MLQKHTESILLLQVQGECKLEVDIEQYVESTTRPHLMDVIYHWSKGASFSEVTSRTDIFEGMWSFFSSTSHII